MNRNTELLEKVMQHILDHPERHDQITWVSDCGTAACFAGWACLLSGWRVAKGWAASVANPINGEICGVRSVAANELGLTEDETYTLFSGDNSVDMLQLMVKDLVNGDALRDEHEYMDATLR